MATLLSAYTEIGFTILPHMLDSDQLEMLKYPGKHVIGFITYDKTTCVYTFNYTKPEGLTLSNTHWSLDIFKKFPYCDEADAWVVFNCPPHKAKRLIHRFLVKAYRSTIGIVGLWKVRMPN